MRDDRETRHILERRLVQERRHLELAATPQARSAVLARISRIDSMLIPIIDRTAHIRRV